MGYILSSSLVTRGGIFQMTEKHHSCSYVSQMGGEFGICSFFQKPLQREALQMLQVRETLPPPQRFHQPPQKPSERKAASGPVQGEEHQHPLGPAQGWSIPSCRKMRDIVLPELPAPGPPEGVLGRAALPVLRVREDLQLKHAPQRAPARPRVRESLDLFRLWKDLQWEVTTSAGTNGSTLERICLNAWSVAKTSV